MPVAPFNTPMVCSLVNRNCIIVCVVQQEPTNLNQRRVVESWSAPLIYLSLAVDREERMRYPNKEGLVASMPLSRWDGEWKV